MFSSTSQQAHSLLVIKDSLTLVCFWATGPLRTRPLRLQEMEEGGGGLWVPDSVPGENNSGPIMLPGVGLFSGWCDLFFI